MLHLRQHQSGRTSSHDDNGGGMDGITAEMAFVVCTGGHSNEDWLLNIK